MPECATDTLDSVKSGGLVARWEWEVGGNGISGGKEGRGKEEVGGWNLRPCKRHRRNQRLLPRGKGLVCDPWSFIVCFRWEAEAGRMRK